MRSERLIDIAERFAGTVELEPLLSGLCESVVRDAEASAVRIWIRRPGDRCLTCSFVSHCSDRGACLHKVAAAGADPGTEANHPRHPLKYAPLGMAVTSGVPFITNDVLADARFPDRQWNHDPRIRAGALLPLTRGGESFGVMAVFAPGELSDGEVQSVQQFAKRIGGLLAAALAAEALQNRVTRLAHENICLRREILEAQPFEQMVGVSPAIRDLRERIERAASAETPVLIVGPSGVGKEFIARTIHGRSRRAEAPFLRVHCSTINADRLEFELFGYEGDDVMCPPELRIGRAELAAGGTLFLHQLERTPAHVQQKLLDMVREGSFTRMGSKALRRFEARLMATTSRKLEELIASGTLIPALGTMLAPTVLNVPPLRDRREDIPLLVEQFVRRFCLHYGRPMPRVTPECLRPLLDRRWPGNVRELCQVVESALVTCPDGPLAFPMPEGVRPPEPSVSAESDSLDAVEREHIKSVLRDAGGVIEGSGGAAARLGLKPSTLRSRMAKLGISRHSQST